MSEQDPALLTNTHLMSAPAGERARLVEAYLLASICALHPYVAQTVEASSHLADLAIDSLQIVELIINNPTVGELAANGVRAAGL
jgi:hypothetical protein